MNYHAPTKQFTISLQELERATFNFVYVIRSIRDLAGLPHTKYEREGLLTEADHAQKGILEAAKALGIDMGADWGNELDVSRD